MDELRPQHLGGAQAAHGGGGGDSGDEPGLLGDVVLCPPVAKAQARRAGHSTEAELELLCVHGILHLLGYDHGDPEEHAQMFGVQDELLDSWRGSRSRERGQPQSGAGADGSRDEALPPDLPPEEKGSRPAREGPG
jgi:probable rRNA maturation factor